MARLIRRTRQWAEKRVCALQVPVPYSPMLEDDVFPDRN